MYTCVTTTITETENISITSENCNALCSQSLHPYPDNQSFNFITKASFCLHINRMSSSYFI